MRVELCCYLSFFRAVSSIILASNLSKPTSYGLHVSLNQEKGAEIKQTIFELLGVKIE